tara:strand:+ start:13 stop:546 length:534 start_codon:yes stop_codon:yes gene_type:complete
MGIPTLISTATASGASEVDITSGIDSTYDEYMFVFTDIGPATDDKLLQFQVNASGESGFNETITSTAFITFQAETDESGLTYMTTMDQAQGTDYSYVSYNIGNGADESAAGIMHLFNPSSTTYVKNFYSTMHSYSASDQSVQLFMAGYINTTAAIDEISFKMDSGNFDGVIQMYGIS